MSALLAVLDCTRPAVEYHLIQVLEDCRQRQEDPDQAAPGLLEATGSVLSGGRRIHVALGAVDCVILSTPERRSEYLTTSDVVHLSAALELYQISVLIRDGLMDGADIHRGLSAARRVFAQDHGDRGWLGRPQIFGANGAILLGDLLPSLAGGEVSVLASSHASSQTRGNAVRHARSAFDAMTTEVALGQFFDVRNENLLLPWGREPGATAGLIWGDTLSVIRHKSARYSVRHLLLIGALLIGPDLDGATAEYLAASGEDASVTFQLRGDELGVFGPPQATGRPVGDDLCEGKYIVLLALAWGRCDDAGRRLLGSILTNPEAMEGQIGEVAALIEDCGARVAHEEIITVHHEAGSRALGRLGDEGMVDTASLEDLAVLADLLTHRVS